MAGTLESRGICIIRPCGRQAANDAWAVSMTEIEFAEDSNCMPVAAVSSVSAELRATRTLPVVGRSGA
jgi:ABC-type glutathione transport system ATPase component